MATLPDVNVSPASIEHVPGILRVIDAIARERKYFDIFEAPFSAEFCKFIEGRITSGHPHFVALSRGEVVGWCEVIRNVFPANAHVGALNMGIVPAFRDRGLGFTLVSATLERARRAGFGRIILSVHTDNLRAIALYEKVGFVREGVLRDASFVDGEYRDSLVMAIVERANAVRPEAGIALAQAPEG